MYKYYSYLAREVVVVTSDEILKTLTFVSQGASAECFLFSDVLTVYICAHHVVGMTSVHKLVPLARWFND